MTGVLKVDDIQDAGANSIVSSNGSGTLTFGSFSAPNITASTALLPDASDGAAIGSASLEFSDLFLADGAVINLGNDQDVTLTHVADTGIQLNSTMKLMFNDASQYIQGASATVLDIAATDEIELTATLVDLNGNLDVSGTYTGAGLMTTGGNIVIPDTGNIGSASDTDAIAIAANGVTTFSQAPVLSGASLTAGTTPLTTLDIDGGTDIGAAIVDADLFIIDDGAGGTNRKTTASRVKTYIGAGANAPYFAARRSNTAQTVANDTYVTIVFNTEVLDSAGTYNPSNGIWTPGTAGKYFVFAQVAFTVTNAADWDSGTIIIDKNSAGYTDTNNKNAMAYITRRGSGSGTDSFYVSQIFDLDADDTVRVQFQGTWSGASANETVGYGKTYFGGYKLV